MNDTVENPVAGAPIPINQNGVKPGPKKLEQFRLACRIAGLPDEAKGQLKDNPEKGRPYMARLRLFNPTGVGTWLLQDWNSDDNIAFGWAHLGDDNCAELGYISLEELATHTGRFGVGIEIDNWFRATPMNKAIGENKNTNDSEQKEEAMTEVTHNEHVKRFTTDVAPLLTPHVGKPVHQRVQLWIKGRTNGLNLTSFLNNGASDDDKRKLLDDLIAILKTSDWSKLPAAPGGQAEVPVDKPAPTPKQAATPPIIKVEVPAPEPADTDDDGKDFEPEAEPADGDVPSMIPADDPVALIMAGLKQMTRPENHTKQLTEEDVRRVVRAELRAIFAVATTVSK